ncbi:MAG: pilus assembly protein, partial [Xanthomonadales bacterium]|nr:pilus assembly protein [Xanthomonadales bacterium]
GVVTQFREGSTWPATGIEYKGPSGGTDYTAASLNTAQLAKNPRYLIEDLGRVRPPGAGPQQESGAGSGAGGSIRVNTYRISARAAGGNENAVRVLESTFDAQTKN